MTPLGPTDNNTPQITFSSKVSYDPPLSIPLYVPLLTMKHTPSPYFLYHTNKILSEKVAQEVEEDSWGTAAERFVADYFDKVSRMEGAGISREGAGRFQAEILRGIFVTAKVTNSSTNSL